MDTTRTPTHPRRTGRRLLATGAFAAASVFGLAACGDDDEGDLDDGVEQELDETGDQLGDLGDETGDAIDEETDDMGDDNDDDGDDDE